MRNGRSYQRSSICHSVNSNFETSLARGAPFLSAGDMTSMYFNQLRQSQPSCWLYVQKAAQFAGLSADALQHALITEYSAGAAIGWHRDRPEFEDVIGISLRAPCVFRFRRKQGTRWERASIGLQPRSTYLLRGPARWDWQHSIPAVDNLRYSITFRSFRE